MLDHELLGALSFLVETMSLPDSSQYQPHRELMGHLRGGSKLSTATIASIILGELRYHVYGRTFYVLTDANALKWLWSKNEVRGKQVHWILAWIQHIQHPTRSRRRLRASSADRERTHRRRSTSRIAAQFDQPIQEKKPRLREPTGWHNG